MLATAQTMCLKWTIKFSYYYSYSYLLKGSPIRFNPEITAHGGLSL